MIRLNSFVSPSGPSGASPAKSRSSNEHLQRPTPSDEDEPRTGRFTHRSESRSSQHPQLLAQPLINLSRSPSPFFPRLRSAHQSEDEDEPDYPVDNDGILREPLVAPRTTHIKSSTKFWQKGGLGRYLLRTATGHQVYTGLLVFWLGGCQFGTLLINRFILWTGTYRLPYPLTMTLMQLAITHVLLLVFANLTRLARTPLANLGFEGIIAPSEPLTTGPQGYRRAQTPTTVWTRLAAILGISRGGITGGGIFDLNWRTTKQVLPLAVIFFAKVVLSNISYAYAHSSTLYHQTR